MQTSSIAEERRYRAAPLRRASVRAVALVLPMSAAAESPPPSTEAPPVLEEVLVVGARLPRHVEDVVGTIDVIHRDQLLTSIAVNATDIVRYTPGISVARADTRFGETEFTIRGLSGNRVATLVDRVPVPDQFDIGAFSNAGQDFLIADAISRVEILRGPASTLFGSDALGGVVAFVTRDPEDFLGGQERRFGISAAHSGADDVRIANASAAARSGSLSGVVHASTLDADALDAGATNDEDPLERRRNAAMLKLVYALRSGDLVRLKVDHFDEDVESESRAVLGHGRQFRNTTRLAGDDERRREALQLDYDFSSAGEWITGGRATLYVHASRVEARTDELRARAVPPVSLRRTFEYEYDDAGGMIDLESRLTTGELAHRLGWGMSAHRADVREARDGRQQDLTTGAVTNVLLGERMPVRDFPNSRITEAAVYLHDEIAWGSVTLIPGARLEHYRLDARADATYRTDNPSTEIEDVSETALAPKLGVQWHASASATLFAQYARGFRAPPFEDVNIGLDIPAFNFRAVPNPDLESETSDGIELGVRVESDAFALSAAVFGADYSDFIESKVNLGPDPESGVLLFQSRNIDEARVYGAEVSLAVPLDDLVRGLDLNVRGTWMRGENRENDEPLNTVDPPELVTQLRWQPNSLVSSTLAVTTVAEQSRVDESLLDLYETDGFVVFDLMSTFTPSPGVRVDVGFFNLTDATYWRWASVRGRPTDDPLLDLLSAPGRYVAASIHIGL